MGSVGVMGSTNLKEKSRGCWICIARWHWISVWKTESLSMKMVRVLSEMGKKISPPLSLLLSAGDGGDELQLRWICTPSLIADLLDDSYRPIGASLVVDLTTAVVKKLELPDLMS
ncbi:hypothetical protein ACLOJK_005869 [Asimina triloba]